FDLRAIRAGLKEVGLDWEMEDYPPAAASPMPAAPLQIRVELGNFRERSRATQLVLHANQHTAAGNHAQALATLRQAVNIDLRYAEAHNNLAWLLLTGPHKLRNPKEALPHARK